ncbi:MAG: RNA polymerase sigma factor [Alphaproteobacteria bacterium]|nr:MAG: RNA polymerase sigma factor [Alphaproteobacteria bacterium]TAF15945.1 MAG: RNA polymerase sigma factor [Alphaproteobacteria bacterium]TAF41938.1 MAG: RNA polymerase sigma factor [Alphaproteobacteria bacterium]TAF76759.1 MAG: RNA polymerase sigma factor [Alphaproteobacteria bacterium]
MIDNLALIHEACRGDGVAFQKLLNSHYPMIYRVAYRFTGHQQDAEDIAQEVCLLLVDKLATYQNKGSFTTWLYRIVVNQCRDAYKKRTIDRQRDKGYTELNALEAADAQEQHKKIQWLYRTVAHLRSPLKETALLVLAEGLSHAEVGEILKCKESTISWRMHEIRKILTVAMEKEHA